ncbi:GTPase Era [Synergistales bacterium]|nr:GTPase Era [Synergistales bacterium]
MTNAPEFRCGVVALVGRPNVGKSSLINALLKTRAAIVSPKPQTTRNAARFIYNEERPSAPPSQIIFTDTPGIHIPKNKLGRFLIDSVENALTLADAVCYLVEAGDREVGAEDKEAIAKLAGFGGRVILTATKCDKGESEQAFEVYRSALGGKVSVCVALSAKSGQGLPEFIDACLPFLPLGEPWFDPDILMDGTERFIAAEHVRAAALDLLRDEVPHCVAVEIDEYKSPDEYQERKKLYIRASLLVETDGQKAIVIGSGGSMLKKIGVRARKYLEETTGHSVYLELWVKVSPHWRESPAVLRRLGYTA